MAEETPRTIVIARVRCRPEQRAGLVELLTTLQEASRRDEGCINYGFSQTIEDENAFVAVEEWRDREALSAHLREPHIREFLAALPAAVDGMPEIASHEVSGTGPLPF
jgi:quinol monooxygenase YgiN